MPKRVNIPRFIDRFTRNSGSSNNKIEKFHEKELSRVFSEDYEDVKKLIFDPRGPVINRLNKIFLVACLVSLFVDPLFFYLPRAKENNCIEVSMPVEIALTLIRSLADAFYFVQIYVRFRTAYVAPSSCIFGRGELVIDPSKIASRYLCMYFWLDLLAALPVPQVCMQLYTMTTYIHLLLSIVFSITVNLF